MLLMLGCIKKYVEKQMVARFFALMIICFFVATIQGQDRKIYLTGKEKVELISTRETKNCFVSIVKVGNTTYLIKQKKDYKKQLSVVRDALSAYIAECPVINNIAQQVRIISCKHNFPGKIKPEWPATIHTIASGETVRVQRKCRYSALRLRQFWAGVDTIAQKGLTPSIITHMTWHRQLPMIVALDLIIGNSDRHCGNLCYDPATDNFCAIDMDDTFNKDLCFLACEKIKMMLEDDKVIFTRQELKALKAMKDTLKSLIKYHKQKDVIEKLYVFAKNAGFSKGNKIYTKKVIKKLLLYEATIVQTYKSAHLLITLLDTIIDRKRRTCLATAGV